MHGGDGRADRCGELGGDLGERDLGSVDELVDDRAGSGDRHLAGETRHDERQSGAHARAQSAERHEVGGLLRLRLLAAGYSDDVVAAVARGEEGSVEVAVAQRAEGLSPDDVQPGHGRRRERR